MHVLVAPCLCSRTPGRSQGQACLMAGTLSRPSRRGQTPTAAGVYSRPPCEFQPCDDRPITWAVRDVKPTWLPTRAQQVWAPARTRCRGERERRGRRSKQASKLCEPSPASTTTTTTTLWQPHHHYPPDTPPSLHPINRPSLLHRAGIFPFPFLWVSVAPRLLSVSLPSANSCATHPPTPTSRCSSIPRCRTIQPLRPYRLLLVCRPVRPPRSFQLKALSNNRGLQLARRLHLASPRELDLTSLRLPASHSLSLLQPSQD